MTPSTPKYLAIVSIAVAHQGRILGALPLTLTPSRT